MPDCDIRCFSGEENWHKITKSTATKANALAPICAACGLTIDRITAFGDDFADLEIPTPSPRISIPIFYTRNKHLHKCKAKKIKACPLFYKKVFQ